MTIELPLLAAQIDWNRAGDWFESDNWRPAARTAALAAGVIVAAIIAYSVVVRGINVAERLGRLPQSVAFALRKVLRWVAFLIAATVLLQVLGVSDSVFPALAGVLALVAAGFVAFWSMLSNIFCAIVLLIARPFMLGDRLTFPSESNLTGTVTDFDLLFTTLRTDDGRVLQIPNNLFFQKMFLRGDGETRKDLSQSLESTPSST
jgi:small-conductance mechanosensitive channel